MTLNQKIAPEQENIHILILHKDQNMFRALKKAITANTEYDCRFQHATTETELEQYIRNSVPDFILVDSTSVQPQEPRVEWKEIIKDLPDTYVFVLNTNQSRTLEINPTLSESLGVVIIQTSSGSPTIPSLIYRALDSIAARKATLHDSQDYKHIVEQATEGIWIINSEDDVVYVNQALAHMLGYGRDEIVGTNSLNYVLKEDRGLLQQKIQNRKNGVTESYEFRILRRDGTPFWGLLSASPNFDEKGNYAGALVMVTDISERKEAEKTIAQERDRALKYFNFAGVMLLVLDSKGRIQQINQKGLQILNYKKEEDLIGRDWFSTCLPEDIRDEVRAIHDNLMRGYEDQNEYFERPVVTRTGEMRDIAWYNTTVRDPEGYRIIATLSSGEDITEKKKAERQHNLLLELSRKAAFETDFNSLLFFIAEQTVNIVPPAESASIFLVNENRTSAILKAWYGFNQEDLTESSIPINHSVITGKVIKSKKPMLIPSVPDEPRFFNIEKGNLNAIQSVMAVPIISKNGESLGIIFCDSRSRKNAFDPDDLKLLESVSAQLAGVIENVRLLDELNQQHQALTRSESEYQNLFNSIFNGFALHEMIYDKNGKPVDYRFLKVNPAFSKMTGLKEKDILGKTALEVLPRTEPHWIEAYGKVARTGKPVRIENYSVEFDKYFEVIAFSPEEGKFATVISDITERSNLINELQFERDRAQNYLDIAEVMIVALDEEGLITLANRKSCTLLGYQESELLGKNWFDTCVPDDDRDRAFSLYQEFMQSSEVSGPDYEQIVLTKDGSKCFARWQSRKLFDREGAPIGTLSSGEDNTARKEAEEALKRYEHIVSSSSDMMAMVNRDLVFLSANAAYCEAFGISEEDIFGIHGEEMFDKEFFDTVILPHVDACLQGKEVVFHEWIDLPKLGRRFMETHYYPYFDEDGNVIGLVTNRRDITSQHQTQQALIESETRLSNIINYSTNMFYSHTPDHEITFVSPQSESILGYTPDELKIKWTTLTTSHPVNKTGIDHTEKAIATGEAQPPYELELRTKSGKHVWVEVHEAPVRHNGKVSAIVGSLTDITSRRIAELENKKTLEALKIANTDLRVAKNRIQGTMEETIRTIAKTVEVRDPYTAGHHRRVSELSVLIACELGLDDEVLKAIELAAVIHDLGKIQVPAEILSKPGRLTDMEFGIVKTHPTVGYELLKDIAFPWPLAEIVYMHHERMDGAGYPRGIAGKDIPIESRIICVADTVEAMSSHRPYRPALGLDVALQTIREDSGTAYDPLVVDACLRIFKSGYHMPHDPEDI